MCYHFIVYVRLIYAKGLFMVQSVVHSGLKRLSKYNDGPGVPRCDFYCCLTRFRYGSISSVNQSSETVKQLVSFSSIGITFG